MRSEFMLAINQLCAERKLPPDTILEAVELALISAYKRNFGAVSNVQVRIEQNTGARVYAVLDVVEAVEDPKTQTSLAEARKVNATAQIGETVLIESTPRDFGRIAAQAAKQVILQRIREAEREAQYSAFADSAGEIAHGTIQSVDLHSKDVVVALDGAEALMPLKEQVPTERYRRGARLRAYVMEVHRGSRGAQITLSRRTPLFLRRLLELEVPEIPNGLVEIKSIAREAGSRSKVAVYAAQEGVDPVGSCVGVRGGRIQNVVTELGGEKIDVVQWSPDIATYIASALSPAKVMNVIPDDSPEHGKTATVIVPDRQLSLAIGKEGQNARLAAKLTGWRIDIKSATEAAEETLGRLEDTTLPPEEMDLLTLAEVLLRRRGAAEVSAEDKALIEQEVARGDMDWPQAEPSAAPAGAEGGRAAKTGVEPQIVPSEAKPQRPDALSTAAPEQEDVVTPPPVPQVLEQEPTFEGEPVEASSGWLLPATQEDLYSGWESVLDQAPDSQDEWEREEIDSPDGVAPGPQKKKKKKSGKSRFQRGGREW